MFIFKLAVLICCVVNNAIATSGSGSAPQPAAVTPVAAPKKTVLSSLSSSSFPLLESVSSLLSLTPSVSIASQTKLYAMNAAEIEGIYANFSADMVPIFRHGAQKIRRTLFKLKNRSPISQLYGIPQILDYYGPMFASFAAGTDIVRDWKMATLYPTGKGPFIYFTPVQWNDVLSGLQMFGSGSYLTTSYLTQLQMQTEFQLDNLKRLPHNRIVMETKDALAMDVTNKNLASAIQQVRSGLQLIYSIHGLSVTKYQNSQKAKNFLTIYFKWIKNLVAVFNRMAPSINDFSTALIKQGNVKSSTFIGNVTSINKLYQTTATNMAYCAELMGDYFQIFNANLEELF